jgi:hypothetical protein
VLQKYESQCCLNIRHFAGSCRQFINKGLARASYILFFILAFGSKDGQDVTISVWMFDILILV